MRAGVLDVDLEVVLEVLADARQVVAHVDADRAQLPGVTDPRQLQQLRGVEGAATQDDLTGADPLVTPAGAGVVDTDHPAALDDQLGDHRPRDHLEVGPVAAPGGGTHGRR